MITCDNTLADRYIRAIDCSIRVFRSGSCTGHFEEKLLTFLRQGIVKTPFKLDLDCVYVC